MDTFDENSDWMEYWRDRFPKVTTKMLDDFAKKYKNSKDEKDDLIAAYNKHNGNMDNIFEEVPCASPVEDDDRFRQILLDAIKNKEIKSYKTFTNGKNIAKFWC